MAEQIKMFHDQLADLIVMDVRRHAHCQGFKSVTLYRHPYGEIPGANWSVGTVNYGDAGPRICKAALQEVTARRQRQYRLV